MSESNGVFGTNVFSFKCDNIHVTHGGNLLFIVESDGGYVLKLKDYGMYATKNGTKDSNTCFTNVVANNIIKMNLNYKSINTYTDPEALSFQIRRDLNINMYEFTTEDDILNFVFRTKINILMVIHNTSDIISSGIHECSLMTTDMNNSGFDIKKDIIVCSTLKHFKGYSTIPYSEI